MSNCFICNVDHSFANTTSIVRRGQQNMLFAQGLESIISVVQYPNQDSAHSNEHTNNYVTYRVNGFRYKGFMYTPLYTNNHNLVYVVFFKVNIVDDFSINLKQLVDRGDFSDFVIYKQPNDVIDYHLFKLQNGPVEGQNRYVKEIDISCNKTFFVKPDEVFGVYYLVLRSVDERGALTINASVSVYFDVV